MGAHVNILARARQITEEVKGPWPEESQPTLDTITGPPTQEPGASSEPGDGEGLGPVFRDGPAQRGPLTTPVLAEKTPGDIFALGLHAVREKLAATHGDSVLTDHSRRILSFYFDQVLKPSLPHNIPVHTER